MIADAYGDGIRILDAKKNVQFKKSPPKVKYQRSPGVYDELVNATVTIDGDRAVVTANAWMPEHNHGTALQPRVESHGDGTATGEGFLLHMQGRWELRVGVAVDGQMERATFGFLIEP